MPMATRVLTDQPSIANSFLAELRDVRIQADAMRFRTNLARIGGLIGYEISKTLRYKEIETETPLGISKSKSIKDDIVIASILRAGLPMHNGLLDVFDKAENAFISAQRKMHKSGDFEIELNKVTSPSLEGKVLILCDPMLATGSSLDLSLQALEAYGKPSVIHICTAIASRAGMEHVERLHPEAMIWIGDLDEELTAKSYIVPGLGDAGDLAFGPKI